MRFNIVKQCACGAKYTAEQYAVLPQPPSGGEMTDGEGRMLTLRNCWHPCNSTMAIRSWVLGRFTRDLVILGWVEAADVYERLAGEVSKNLSAACHLTVLTFRGCAWDLANAESMT